MIRFTTYLAPVRAGGVGGCVTSIDHTPGGERRRQRLVLYELVFVTCVKFPDLPSKNRGLGTTHWVKTRTCNTPMRFLLQPSQSDPGQ